MHSEHTFEYRGQLFYRRYGRPGCPALLCLHGFGDTSATFEFIRPTLQAYFEVFALDFRGHGKSPPLQEGYYSTGMLLSDVARFTSEVLPDTYYLLGHSMGAGVAARFAGLVPDEIKGLILLEGFAGLVSPHRDAARLRESLRLLRRSREHSREKTMSLAGAESRLALIHPRVRKDRLQFLAQSLTRANADGSYSWHQDPMLRAHFSPVPFAPELSRYLWAQIACPVLLFFGKHTQFHPGQKGAPDQKADFAHAAKPTADAPLNEKSGSEPSQKSLHELSQTEAIQEILSHFRDIRYIELEEAGHNMHHDCPEQVMEAIALFAREKLGLQEQP